MCQNYVTNFIIFTSITFIANALDTNKCNEECTPSPSCDSYVECQSAKLTCMASCNQARAFETLAKSSEKTSTAQIEAIRKLTETLVSMADSLKEMNQSLKNQ